jgi:hypothetical protein
VEPADQTGAPLHQAHRTTELLVEAVGRSLGDLDHTVVCHVVATVPDSLAVDGG